jgi:hypothetical protein
MLKHRLADDCSKFGPWKLLVVLGTHLQQFDGSVFHFC